ncbi:UDP-N-acetylmuramate [Catenovulum agarivorans DS-2]|uniref:UDP-N-acetylmuramate--L-alanyl-gamma-D-glutamyl-meso-2,6-diaminoheptandioate ligase n=1 Tax=Catenovulum agarivorans DS-2 TaxID=1328313 RepID=W7QVY1_9ALTE|nr:UDP-N-acetylmuramate:L-alanyl-gamma-D-glutamyl-meso-diaminopimelate ligase [Catenovulum agarivorans]EWH09440.1 UDP-N-acetylmuramate [Catenovulum agarivorans DS-2]
MHIHILGICGTFMGGLAVLAKELGYKVTGSDLNVYPPMSTQLESQGIELVQGYDPAQLDINPDLVVIGNAMSRGNPVVEAVLDKNIPYISGPQWLFEHVLKDKWVLAVAGTHGKTTTSSMLAWILEHTGCKPGFLIGGVANNFAISARLGDSIFFVIEADEYDSAFFDKRSKFVHYHPRTLILNNLEFDHADIFENLAAIKKQFHHLVRIVPQSGLIISHQDDKNVEDTLAMGCWSEQNKIGKEWSYKAVSPDCTQIEIYFNDELQGLLNWPLLGEHNAHNALMAIIAARHAGVKPVDAIAALAEFKNVKRRLEKIGEVNSISVFDDFAHHPTAITTTLQGVVANNQSGRVIAVLEPRSNTMKMGFHKQELAESLNLAEAVFLYQDPGLKWSLDEVTQNLKQHNLVCANIDELAAKIADYALPNDKIVVMSNGGFGGIHQKIIKALEQLA